MKNHKSPKNVVTTYFWRATAAHYKSITYRLSFLMRSLLTVQDGFESVMKVLTGQGHLNADKLIKELQTQGYFDDLPDGVRSSFGEQVLKTLPSLRNRLGGHGQGAEVIAIPKIYGELAVHLAAAFHNFLIAKHIERQPPKAPPKETVDDIDSMFPF